MALLPVRRDSVARPGSQAVGRWDPFGEYRQSGAEGRPLRRARREGGFEFRVMLPGQADTDKITGG